MDVLPLTSTLAIPGKKSLLCHDKSSNTCAPYPTSVVSAVDSRKIGGVPGYPFVLGIRPISKAGRVSAGSTLLIRGITLFTCLMGLPPLTPYHLLVGISTSELPLMPFRLF